MPQRRCSSDKRNATERRWKEGERSPESTQRAPQSQECSRHQGSKAVLCPGRAAKCAEQRRWEQGQEAQAEEVWPRGFYVAPQGLRTVPRLIQTERFAIPKGEQDQQEDDDATQCVRQRPAQC